LPGILLLSQTKKSTAMKKSARILTATICAVLSLQCSIINAQEQSLLDKKSDEAIRSFRVRIPNADLKELRKRILDTRWPDKELVADQSQGAGLFQLQGLVNYWGKRYNWRNAEAKLNSFPQFITTIDNVDIHFIHVRSKEANAMPLIISHGWPGSVFELLKIIDPLTNPTAYGGKSEDAFDVIIPSLPGFGFSGKPTVIGWDPDRIARAWDVLMKRLGYNRYVAQGGDWGAAIVNAMGRQAPAGLLGIHNNLPSTVPGDVAVLIAAGATPPANLTEQERSVFNELSAYNKKGNAAYLVAMSARPQAIGYGLTDSPAGLAAWMLLHPGFALWTYGDNPQQSPTKDEVLDNITLYWLTNTAASSARIYWENMGRSITNAALQKTSEISIPVAITVFPEDIYKAPESWARRAYRNLFYFRVVDKGGHFAAWEQPQLFTEEMRASFRSLR
jgi:pimeloyl-ACP methyl ester carboxylesterase